MCLLLMQLSCTWLVENHENHGLGDTLLKWIETWLVGREQRVILNGQQTDWMEVKSGVPQGTVLAPLLFIIFVNFIDTYLTSRLWKFADDLKLAKEIDSVEHKRALQSDLNALFNWTEEWQMEFNVDKCKVFKIGVSDHDKYNINGNYLQNVNEERDLGVCLTNDLKFSRYCQEARKKTS